RRGPARRRRKRRPPSAARIRRVGGAKVLQCYPDSPAMVMRRVAQIVVALLAAAYAAGAAHAANPPVLVSTKAAGCRHESIPAAIQAVRDLGAKNGFDVTATEDDTVFSAAGLAPYDAVIFLLTIGDVLDNAEQAAFETWLRAG